MEDQGGNRQTANRRRVLYATAASIATAGLAGCSSSNPSGGTSPDGTTTNGEGPKAAFRGFIAGFEADDLAMVQEHIHPESRLLDEESGLTESDVAETSIEILALEVAMVGEQQAVLNARLNGNSPGSDETRTFWNEVQMRRSDGTWLVMMLRSGRATPSPEQIGTIPGDGSPEATVRAFVTALDGDDASAYRTTVYPGTSLRTEFTEENIGGIDTSLVAIETAQVGEDQAVVNARVEFEGSSKIRDGTYWLTFELRQYGGAWRVNRLLEGRQTPAPTPTATPAQTPTVTPTPTGGEPTATERTDSTAFFEGFEDGTDRWEVFVDSGWESTDSIAYSGKSAAVANRDRTTTRLAATDVTLSDPVSEFSYYWFESTSSFGGGLQLLNANGDMEIGFATDNPQWVVDDADGATTVADGEGYTRWVETAVSFDWDAGTATVSFRDLETGTSYQDSHSLKQGDGIASIQLSAFTSVNGWENDSCKMAWDDISLRV